MSVQLQLKKFNMEQMTDNRVVVVVAKRGSGKSFLVRDIMYHKRHMPDGIVFSATEESNSFWSNHIPDSYIYDGFDSATLEAFVKRQKKRARHGSQAPSFLMLDDCAFDKSFTKDKALRSIFFNGRHWRILLIMTLQYALDLTPDMRSNVDFVFVLRENIIQNRERLYRNFFGIFATFDAFCSVLDQTTENYECLVLDNTVQSNRIEDCVFWYKAEEHPRFRVGSDSYWAYHLENYQPDADSDEDEQMSRRNVVQVTKTGVKVRR